MQGLNQTCVAFDSTLLKNFSFYSVFVNAVCFFPCIGSSLVSWDFQTHQQVTPGYVERKGRPILTAGIGKFARVG